MSAARRSAYLVRHTRSGRPCALFCDLVGSTTLGETYDPEVLRPRYRGRSERYCALEGGHAAQNLLLAAEALGLAAVPVAAFDDQAVLEALGLPRLWLALYIVPVDEAA